MKKPFSVKIAFVLRIAFLIAGIMIFFFGGAWVRSGVGSCFWFDHFGVLCPGCGGTRALVSLLHLDFVQAFHFNEAFTCGLYPALILFYLVDLCFWIYRIVTKKEKKTPLEYLLSVVDFQKKQEETSCSI